LLVAQRWILAALRNRRFFSVAELNAAIWDLLPSLNDRLMKHLGVSRRQLFEQLERPLLRPLPTTRYEMGEWRDVTVNIEYHVVVESNYYSVLYQLVHQRIEVRLAVATVEIFLKSRPDRSSPEPGLADAGGADQEQIPVLSDPGAGGEGLDEGLVEAAAMSSSTASRRRLAWRRRRWSLRCSRWVHSASRVPSCNRTPRPRARRKAPSNLAQPPSFALATHQQPRAVRRFFRFSSIRPT
jgi:hypothetical protein